MLKKKVLVILGGTSRERQISLKTAKFCIIALKKLGYKVQKFDPKFSSFNQIRKNNIDFIFNALHGKDGEDGKIQVFFEYLGIPYTHSGVLSSSIAIDKELSKTSKVSGLE